MTWIKPDKPKINSPVTNIILNEGATALNPSWYREMANNSYAGAVSKKNTQNGMPSYRIELRRNDPDVNGSKRSEIATLAAETPLVERIYVFNILLPGDGSEDYVLDPKSSEIIAQWHNTPDPGEEWTFPPLSMHIRGKEYVIYRVWDDAPLSTNEGILEKGNYAVYNLGEWGKDKGRYVKWTFHVRWGWLASQNPTIEVLKDDKKILDLNGLPNTTNDKAGVHQKLGLYKNDWAVDPKNSIISRRVIYYNNVSVK